MSDTDQIISTTQIVDSSNFNTFGEHVSNQEEEKNSPLKFPVKPASGAHPSPGKVYDIQCKPSENK